MDQRSQARERVVRKRGFHAHLLAYVVANAAMVVAWYLTRGPFWPVWPMLGWGSGLLAHMSSAYRRPISDASIERELGRLR